MSRFDTEQSEEFNKKKWGGGWRVNSDLINTHVNKNTQVNDVFKSLTDMKKPKQQDTSTDKLPERPINVRSRFPDNHVTAIRRGIISFTQQRKRNTGQ